MMHEFNTQRPRQRHKVAHPRQKHVSCEPLHPAPIAVPLGATGLRPYADPCQRIHTAHPRQKHVSCDLPRPVLAAPACFSRLRDVVCHHLQVVVRASLEPRQPASAGFPSNGIGLQPAESPLGAFQ